MKKLRTIIAATLLLASLAAQSQIQPVDVDVVDAANNLVGRLDPNGSVVTLEVDSHLIRATVRTTHMSTSNPTYFASSDCSGQAFVAAFALDLFEPHSIVTLSNSVYAAPHGPAQAVMTNSRLDPGINGCQVATLLRSDLVPASLVRDLSPHFQPPFSLRVSAAAAASATAPALSPGALVILASALGLCAVFLLRSRS